jgi:fructose-1,6-bisphosphatase I
VSLTTTLRANNSHLKHVCVSGEYAAVFDPLDGSSNIDTGLPTGTIFGVYRTPQWGPKDALSTVMQKGSELVAAGYCLYSASTHLVCTLRTGLHVFTLDDGTLCQNIDAH